jgi:hypothetical protein
MKVHVPISSAFPAALAAASIALSIVLLPGGSASVRSSGVAPALRLVAGDVALVVGSPVLTAAKAHRTPVAPSTVVVPRTNAQTEPTHQSASPSRTHKVPAHGLKGHGRVSSARPHAVKNRRETPTAGHVRKAKAVGHVRKARAAGHGSKAEPARHAPMTKAVAHGRKVKAVRQTPKAKGHARKATSSPPSAAAQSASPPNGGHGHAYGRRADPAPPGPPAVPRGHAKPGHGDQGGKR